MAVELAGALAGGYLGHKYGDGEMSTLLLGAAVGAMGAGIAERKYEKHVMAEEKKEKDWEKEFR